MKYNRVYLLMDPFVATFHQYVELEWENDPSLFEDEAPKTVVFEVEVTRTRDAYGTGDSPTLWESQILNARYLLGQKQINLGQFDTHTLEWVEEEAVIQAQEDNWYS